MSRIFNNRMFRRCAGILSLLVLLAYGFAFAPAEAADPLKIGYRGSQNFQSYSTRLALKANPTQWDYALLTVEGGVRPYSVSMSNPILEIRPEPNGSQYQVFAKKVGTTILTIKDSKGASLTREVVVYDPSVLPLVLGALPNASNPVAVGQGRGFGVSQGKPPYKVVSANTSIARIDGPSQAGIWTVWGVSAGMTTITVTDAAGQKAQGTVYVGTTKPLMISADATLLVNGKGELTIDSGNPPYTVTTSSHLSAVLKGNDSQGRPVYTLTAKSAGQGTVTVRDSKGLSQSRTITVKEWVSLSFPQLTGDLRTIDVGQTTKLAVSGGTAPYTVTVDKPALVTLAQQGTGQYTVTGRQAGIVGFTVKDATGTVRSLSLTIRALPTLTLAAPDTMMIGVTGKLSLIGGAPPFTVTASGNALTLTKTDEKTYTLTPKAPGSATLTVKDSKGTTQQKTITINAPALTLSGDTSPLEIGHTRPFDIKGGFGAYTLTLSNANAKAQLLTTTSAYTRYNVSGVKEGTVVITVKDSQGKIATLTLTIRPPANPLKLLVSSNTLQLGATGADAIRTLSIQGGTAPYSATVSGSQLTLTKVSETQYQMVPKAAGTATITVKDAKGATAQQTMTVIEPFKFTFRTDFPLKLAVSSSNLQIGANGALTIEGGTAPYTVSASGSLALTKVSETQYRITAQAAGTAVITVKDAKGAAAQQNITVAAPVQAMKLNLSASVLQLGGSIQTLTIQGGTAPYLVKVSGPQLNLRQVGGNRYDLIPVSPGTVMISARDARGTEISQTVSVVLPGQNPLILQASSLTVRRTQPAEIRLIGGAAPYRLLQRSGPPAQIRQVGANVFQVMSPYAGEVQLQALDARGQSAMAKLTIMN